MKRYSMLILSFLYSSTYAQQHYITYLTKIDATIVKSVLTKYGLLNNSYKELKQSVDKDIETSLPKDSASGYTHKNREVNYMLMFNSGLIF